MSLYVIADLHLSSDGEKSMDVFGARWKDYIQKIEKNWKSIVTDADTVVIPGDISWALRLEDAVEDLRFLDSLPGQKLISKGNHDFWWTTAAKMNTFFQEQQLSTLKMLYNNAFLVEEQIVCGSRGWFLEAGQQKTVGDVDYQKIVNREVIRLRMSLDAAVKLQKEDGRALPITVFLHFPVVFGDAVCHPILELLQEYGIKTCYYGHVHGAYYTPKALSYEGIDFILCAADYLQFAPLPVISC